MPNAVEPERSKRESRSLARGILLAGCLLLGLSFLWAAVSADAFSPLGAPSWGFVVPPIALLIFGSVLISITFSSRFPPTLSIEGSSPGISKGSATYPIVMGSACFLMTTGVGLGVMALIVSSALFYGCAPSECSTYTPVPVDSLTVAGNLGLVGLGILTIGSITLGVSRFLPAGKGPAQNAKASKSLRQ